MEEREVAFPPAHTAEHLLNQVMVRMFGCERSYNAHIERKKSKMSFYLDHKPSRQEEKEIERQMLSLIEDDLPVTFEYCTLQTLPEGINRERLPEDVASVAFSMFSRLMLFSQGEAASTVTPFLSVNDADDAWEIVTLPLPETWSVSV